MVEEKESQQMASVNPEGSPRQKRAARTRPRTARKTSASRTKREAPRVPMEPTAARAAKFAGNLVEFERATFGNAALLLTSLNDQSEKAIRHAVASAKWMPKEGQKLVEEWQRTLRHSLKDFSKTVDKSFDLLSKYFARLEAESAGRET